MEPFARSLFIWLQTFDQEIEIDANCLTDGIKLAKVLNKIVPSYFDDEWLAKLKNDLNDDQWRLKVSNIKKLIERIFDYLENNLCIILDRSKFHPDANLIGRDRDLNELSKLMQLVLCIAVNCENKQAYICKITNLDLDVQHFLMLAIEQQNAEPIQADERSEDVFALEHANIMTSSDVDFLKEQLVKASDTIKLLHLEEDKLAKRIHDLTCKLAENEDEKSNLELEIEKLNKRLESIEQAASANESDELAEQNQHVLKLKARLDSAEKELLKSDSQKEELLIKIELMQNDLESLNQQNEELQRQAKETKLLKDELDIHRMTADSIAKYEERIDSYKKKLEELSETKKQIRSLEDKNKLLVESNIILEEEIKKMNLLKSQIVEYKRQVSELHQQVIEKTHQNDKNEFDLKKINEKYDILFEEKQILEKEKFELKTQLVSLTSAKKSSAHNLDSNFSLMEDPIEDHNYTIKQHNLDFEIKSEEVDIKERLLRLELENKHLREKVDVTNQEDLLLMKANYEDAKQRIIELEQDNRTMNKKLIESDSKLNDMIIQHEAKSNDNQQSRSADIVSINQEHAMQEMKIEIENLKLKLNDRDHLLNSKEAKINEIEEKYKKAIEKAKEVYTLIEPATLNGANSLNSNGTTISTPIINTSSIDDMSMCANLSNEQLKQMLAISNQKLINLSDEYERHKSINEFEQRLIASSVHNLAFSLMRNSATERLRTVAGLGGGSLQAVTSHNSFHGSTNSNLNSSNLSLNNSQTSVAQSFLTKQRQVAARRINNLENVSNS